VALGLAAALQVGVTLRSPVIAFDGVTFITIAQRLPFEPAKVIREHDQHPGYPALILATYWGVGRFLTGNSPLAWAASARLASWLCGLLSVVVFWVFARRTFDARTAAVATILVATLPLLRRNAADGMSDTPQLLFYLLAAWMMKEGMASWRPWWFLGAGVSSGLAYWIRPEGLSVAIVGAVVLGIVFLRRQQPRWRVVALSLATLVAATALVAAPYVLIKGRLTSKKDYWQLLAPDQPALGSPAPAQPAPPQRPAPPAGEPSRAERPDADRPPAAAHPDGGTKAPALSSALLKAFRAVGQTFLNILRWELLLPFAVGLFARNRPKPQPPAGLLVLLLVLSHLALAFGLDLVAGYVGERHLIPVLVLLSPWVAAGVIRMADWLGALGSARRRAGDGGSRRRWALWALMAAIVAVNSRACLGSLHGRHAGCRVAAAWVGAQARPGDAVLSNSPYVPYYSGISALQVDTPERLAAALEAPGASRFRFVVLFTKEGTLQPEWLAALAGRYERVEIEGLDRCDTGRFRAVVFEAKGSQKP
jgi:4-amino-4-deoxy-L-arabinose transferase-like glycosyltransferase